MQRVQAFLKFWYHFIVGDDWHLAAGVAVALTITASLTSAGLNVWILFPLIVMACLLLSVWQAVNLAHPAPTHRAIVIVGQWLKLWLPLVMIVSVPILVTYLQNLSETSVQDLVLPFVLNILAVTIIAAIYFRNFLKDQLVFYLAAVFTAVVVINNYANNSQTAYTTFGSFWPLPVPTALFAPLYWIVAFYVMYRLARWTARELTTRRFKPADVMLAITLFISGVFVLQAVPATVDLATAWPQFFYHPPALTTAKPTAAQLANKPNIYYLVLENYDAQSPVPDQSAYTTSGFAQFLTNQGFYTVPSALSNYPYTVDSVAATLSAGYLSDQTNKFSSSLVQTTVPYSDTIRFAPVIQRLKALGYSYDLHGQWGDISDYSALANRTYSGGNEFIVAGHHFALSKFTDNQLQQNVFWPVIRAGLGLGHFQLLGYNNETNPAPSSSQFAQLQAPIAESSGGHFVFKDMVNSVSYADVESTISQIMSSNHGRAVIILQSGEAAETVTRNNPVASLQENQSNMLQWPQLNLQQKYGMLASYYIPGAAPTDLAQSGDPVNAFRLLLNTDFSAQLPYLQHCYYGYPQGRNEAFVYAEIGRQLNGQADAGCPANGNFIKPGPTKTIQPKAKRTNANEIDDDD